MALKFDIKFRFIFVGQESESRTVTDEDFEQYLRTNNEQVRCFFHMKSFDTKKSR